MTDLMTRPDDTGEIPRFLDRTELIRPISPPAPAPTYDADGATGRISPAAVNALLHAPDLRRADADPTIPTRLIEPMAGVATGAELAVDARKGCRTVVPNDEDFTTEPTVPPKPLPEPPKPTPGPADAQQVGYAGKHRAADTAPVAEVHPAVIQPAPATLAVEEAGRLWPNAPARLIDWARALLGLGGGTR